jgi:hypothetical protein
MANLKFFKAAYSENGPANAAVGAIWFDTTNRLIKVKLADGTWQAYSGLQDAKWLSATKQLELTKADGSKLTVDFSDVASAAALGVYEDTASNEKGASAHARINQAFAEIGTKLEADDQVVKSVNTTADAGVALVHKADGELSVAVTEGKIEENNGAVVLGGQVYTAIEDVKDQIADKNVSAEGDAYVSATAADNKVTVAATQGLIDAVDLANSAVQKVTVLGQELENGGELTVAQAKTALGLGSAAYVDTTAFDAAGTGATQATAAKKEILGYTEGEEIPTTDAQTIKGINDRIDSVAGDAKSYSIVAVTEDLGANVKEAFKLVDEDGVQAGAQINIYKDSALQNVELVNQELQFTYLLASGDEETVGVDVSAFLAESEFADGLQVADHIVKVKIADGSESFLSVDANGLKLSGVQDAINTAEGNAKTYADGLKATIDGVIEENEKTTAAALTELDGRVDVLEAKNATIDSALQQADITTGSANGTIAVKGTDVAVAGLGSAAFTESNAYATAAQGQLADSAVQSITVLGEVLEDGGELTVEEAKAALGLKDAAYVTVESLNATAQGYATTAKNEVIGDAANDTKDSKTIEGVKKYVDAQVADGLSWAIFE